MSEGWYKTDEPKEVLGKENQDLNLREWNKTTE